MHFLLAYIKAAGVVRRDEHLNSKDYLGSPPECVVFNHELRVQAKAQMATTNIYVTGHVSTVVSYQCARCLTEFEKNFEGEFSQVFGLDQQIIDVSQDIKETVLLEIPIKSLCRKDCRGICSKCGKNLNRQSCGCRQPQDDPRLQSLKNYPFKK